MTVIISNQRVNIRSFSVNRSPMPAGSSSYRYLGKTLGQSITRSSYWADDSDDMTLNPYSRAFFLLWLTASLVAVGVHYL